MISMDSLVNLHLPPALPSKENRNDNNVHFNEKNYNEKKYFG